MKANSEHIIEDFRGETLVPRELLRAITKRIVDNIHPEKVILFGDDLIGKSQKKEKFCMTENTATVLDWVAKAELDFKGALDLAQRRKDPLPDKVVYDCAQCAENYLYLSKLELE